MNRRQRRAQATTPSKDLNSVDDIPMARPSEIKPSEKVKTLYELAAERQAQLQPHTSAFDASPSGNVVNVKIGPDGAITRDDGGSVEELSNTVTADEAVPPILDSLFLALSLSAFHFTLETLTVHQYAQELLFRPIFKHTVFMAFPTLFLLIHLFRGHLFSIPASALSVRVRRAVVVFQQVCFVVIANVAGCYLIHLTNDKGYYAVMKNAPSVGTVWIWAILELGIVGALAGVVGPGAYAWYWGYGIW